LQRGQPVSYEGAMPDYFHLNTRAWRQLRRSWALPRTRSLDVQSYFFGGLRSAAAAVQTCVAGAQRAAASKNGAIVILGFWRSGTTLLHELLCTNDRFGFPTTYACLNPHHFILTQKRALARPGGQFRRPQDRMVVSPQMPQEDEFALLCLGARSPYEGLLTPGNFAEALTLADPDDLPAEDRKRWRKTFDEFFRGVSLVSGGKPVVLKSPTHSYRVATLRELLPDARFILIVRDPYEVFGSMVRTYQTLSSKYGLGPSLADDEIRHVLLSERPRFEAKLLAGVNGLPSNRFATVKYEQLIRDPLSVIERLYEQLELSGFEQARPKLAGEIANRSDYVQSNIRLSDDWRHRIHEQWRNIFEHYGYAS
jgi:hypothetical protein